VRITPSSPALGARVEGVDLGADLPATTWDALAAAFARFRLLHFSGQDLDDDQHVAAARHFGPIAPERSGSVGFVSNHRPDGSLGSHAASFHIDYGFFPRPYEAISLYGLEVPNAGTETWFANAVEAARTLPPTLRARVEGRHARAAVDVTCAEKETVVRVRAGRLDETYPHQVRPVLWPHHRDGAVILGVWEQQTDAIVELDAPESTELIEELFAHLYRPEHRYVHRWEPGDLVIWDNHALQHARPDVGDVGKGAEPRTLRRVCVGAAQDLSIFANYGRRP
jgi:alpha-ketoglutarate-dependent taurine dioxygenase